MAQEVTLGDVDLASIKIRSLTGTLTLISRSFFIQIISTAGLFLLTVFLGRPEIGLFIAVNDMVSILGYFSDIGLAASLVQKKSTVTLSDLRTSFTMQQLLVLALIGVLLLLLPWLSSYYHISGSQIWLVYALLTGFFLASLKTIPSVILERQLRFEILASVEIIENIIFYFVAVLLAWRGFGVTAYAWAVLLRGLVGTSMLYLLSPWNIGLEISRPSLKILLSFGLPYQINTLLATVKDRFLNIFLWRIIGADGVGIIGWAQSWSQKPLRFIMDNVTKVTFPSFSRLQDHPQELKHGIEKMLFFISFLTFPIVGGMAVLAPQLVNLIPRYDKWAVALIPLTLYCFNSALAGVSTPMTSVLNALGKVKINTYLMIMWTVLTWIITPVMAIRFHYLGVAYATGIIALTSFVPVLIVRKYIKFDFMSSVLKPGLSTLAMLSVSILFGSLLPRNLFFLILNALISAVSYLVFSYLIIGPVLFNDMSRLVHAFTRRKT